MPCVTSDNDTPQRLTLATADDVELEAEARVPAEPLAAVVLCHPHPLHGGDMTSLVPSELFRILPEAGIAAERFNFRGVGASSGTHGHGRDEQADVAAAVADLAERVPDVPLVVAGWSFGGDTSLAVVDDRIDAWFPIAATLRILEPDEYRAGTDPRPKVLAQPQRDQFNPPERALTETATWVATEVRTVPGADHFLIGRTSMVAEWLIGVCRELADA